MLLYLPRFLLCVVCAKFIPHTPADNLSSGGSCNRETRLPALLPYTHAAPLQHTPV